MRRSTRSATRSPRWAAFPVPGRSRLPERCPPTPDRTGPTRPPGAPPAPARGLARRPVVRPAPASPTSPGRWSCSRRSATGSPGRSGLQFWQVYYVTTPHRWITLLLVFARPRPVRAGGGGRSSAVAAAVVAVCPGRAPDDRRADLPAGDRLRLERVALRRPAPRHLPHLRPRSATRPDRAASTVEKWAMRLFLLYVILRVATATWPDAAGERWLRAVRLVRGRRCRRGSSSGTWPGRARAVSGRTRLPAERVRPVPGAAVGGPRAPGWGWSCRWRRRRPCSTRSSTWRW